MYQKESEGKIAIVKADIDKTVVNYSAAVAARHRLSAEEKDLILALQSAGPAAQDVTDGTLKSSPVFSKHRGRLAETG